jgi:hypothetical protein
MSPLVLDLRGLSTVLFDASARTLYIKSRPLQERQGGLMVKGGRIYSLVCTFITCSGCKRDQPPCC